MITIGSGMLLAAMDIIPAARYAVDVSGYTGDGLARYVETLDSFCSFVAVAAIAMSTDPEKLREAVSVLRERATLPVHVYSNVGLALDELDSFDDLASETLKYCESENR